MDHQNEEFEVFLRKFHLRAPGPLPEPVPTRGRSNGRWVLAAAAVAAAVLLATALVRNFAGSARPYATVEVAGDSVYKEGEQIGAGRVAQSGARESMVIGLEDGTRVELRSESELMLEAAEGGVRIRLNAGSIIVNAAQQRTGHLSVETRDLVASVVGTVFLVQAESAGSRVAVIDGDVEVKHGAALKKLAAGEHVATNPTLESHSIADEIAWSRNSQAHIALLRESAPPAAPPIMIAREEEPRRQLSPIRIEPNSVAPITVAPITVTPMSPPAQPQSPNNLPDGPGKDILNRDCSACHRPDAVGTVRLSNKWEILQLINREIEKGARISEPDIAVLVDYLFTYQRSVKGKKK